VATQISQTSKEINCIIDYIKRLASIFEAFLNGENSSEEMKKQFAYLKLIQIDTKIKEKIQDNTISQIKLHLKKNFLPVENLNGKIISLMDEMCERYARICGNDLNLQ